MSVGFWRTFLFDITTQNNLLFQSDFSMKNPFNSPETFYPKKIKRAILSFLVFSGQSSPETALLKYQSSDKANESKIQ